MSRFKCTKQHLCVGESLADVCGLSLLSPFLLPPFHDSPRSHFTTERPFNSISSISSLPVTLEKDQLHTSKDDNKKSRCVTGKMAGEDEE